ncbi:MAG: cystathionine gamma-synthase [Oligoflexus sp.]
MKEQDCQSTTIAVRTGIDSDTQYGAVVPPIHLSSTFSFVGFEEKRKYDYTRSGNPTRDTLAEALAALEGACAGIVTSTGMSAITLVCHLLQPGDLIIAPHDCYGGTYRLLSYLAKRAHFEVDFIDFNQSEVLQAALARKPKICWLETPSNPLLRIVDIQAVAQLKAPGTILVADNTFLSPVGQKPIALGADIVVHSTTKYINGHSDVVGGAVICKDAELHQELAWLANCLGITGAPFDSYLTLRGLRTLPVRFRAHEENAQAIAQILSDHPAVERVYYPGLAKHPGHEIARRQQSSFGAMISFSLKGQELAVRAFLEGLRHFSLAESLGGVESLIAHPASMTHAAMSREARETAGISDGLLRLSVGIEDSRDLSDDIIKGLQRAAKHSGE